MKIDNSLEWLDVEFELKKLAVLHTKKTEHRHQALRLIINIGKMVRDLSNFEIIMRQQKLKITNGKYVGMLENINSEIANFEQNVLMLILCS